MQHGSRALLAAAALLMLSAGTAPAAPETYRINAASVGNRPCGVYLSTASGSSRESRASSSCRDNPVCLDKVSSTSGPIACSNCGGVTGWFGPVLTQARRTPDVKPSMR